MTPRQQAEKYLSAQAVEAWGGGVTADFINIAVATKMICEIPQLWPKIKPLKSVEDYIRKKIAGHGGDNTVATADAAIEGMNQEFREKANVLIRKMNDIIGEGVTSKEKAQEFIKEFRTFEALVRDRKG